MQNNAPVIVGAAEVANKDPDLILHPVELIEQAVRAAVADAGADVLPSVGMILSSPLSIFTGEDAGAMVAERFGLGPVPTVQALYSGAGPHKLLARACRGVRDGEFDAALIVGGIADSSVRNARRRGLPEPAPPTAIWSQGSSGVDTEALARQRADQEGRWEHGPVAEGRSGVAMPSSIFALIDSAMAASAGRDAVEQRSHLGRLMAPFTEVAASRPDLAWFPIARTAEELSTPTPQNRLVSEPYTKLMCSFPTIDLAAALLVTSEDVADRVGVTSTRVHPWGLVAASEPGPPSTWPSMDRSRALAAVVERLLASTEVSADEIAGFDLYSCFPAAVQLATQAFGIDPIVDGRPLTRTGGLPYLGGPGASYSLHGLAATVDAVRRSAGTISAAVGVGGAANDFSAAVVSVDEPRVEPDWVEVPTITESLLPAMVACVESASGEAVVDAMTVFHEAERGPVEAPVIARLDDGSRVGARAGDPALPAALSGTSLVGHTVLLTTHDDGRVTYLPN